MERMVSIYVLKDPRTGAIRYVGKANDPKTRLSGHLYNAKTERTRKANWLKQLLRLGLTPFLEIIETCSESEWQCRERFWIAEMRLRGAQLMNATDGGDSAPRGIVYSSETRKRMSLAKKGKPLSPEHAAKLRAINKGRRPSAATLEASRIARSKLPPPMLGKRHRPETIAKMRASRLALQQANSYTNPLKGKRREDVSKRNREKLRQAAPNRWQRSQ